MDDRLTARGDGARALVPSEVAAGEYDETVARWAAARAQAHSAMDRARVALAVADDRLRRAQAIEEAAREALERIERRRAAARQTGDPVSAATEPASAAL